MIWDKVVTGSFSHDLAREKAKYDLRRLILCDVSQARHAIKQTEAGKDTILSCDAFPELASKYGKYVD